MSRPASRQVTLADGAQLDYSELGTGQPLVYVPGAGGIPGDAAFLPALAQRFRVLAPWRPEHDGSPGTYGSAREEAELLAAFIRQVAGGPVHLIAESAGGAVGCWLAILQPALVSTLVLVAPSAEDTELRERLREITAPTLVLWGTADQAVPPEHSQVFVRAIPNSYRMLIYGAGHALPVAACRAFVTLVEDFIDRGEAFVVSQPAPSTERASSAERA
jgi:pimeloyl-ACP methyl ester carboxylesterase